MGNDTELSIRPIALFTRLINGIIKLIHDILTGSNANEYDSGRFWMAMSFMYYNYLAQIAANSGHPWSPTDYATGISVIAVAFSMNMRIKDNSQPLVRFNDKGE